MKKKLFSVLSLLLLSLTLLTGCADRELKSVIEAYANMGNQAINGFTQKIMVTQGDFSYESYFKQVEFNGASYKITENISVLNEVGASERVTTTSEVSYIDNGYLIKKVEGRLTKTDSATTAFEGKLNLRKEYFDSYTIVEEGSKKTFSAVINNHNFSSFVNTSISGVTEMTLTLVLTNNKVVSSVLEYNKADGTNVVIEMTTTGRISSFAVPEYN